MKAKVRTVYAVEQGRYPDRATSCLFESRADAEAYLVLVGQLEETRERDGYLDLKGNVDGYSYKQDWDIVEYQLWHGVPAPQWGHMTYPDPSPTVEGSVNEEDLVMFIPKTRFIGDSIGYQWAMMNARNDFVAGRLVEWQTNNPGMLAPGRYYTEGLPAAVLGVEGDTAMDWDAARYYVKVRGSWCKVGSQGTRGR